MEVAGSDRRKRAVFTHPAVPLGILVVGLVSAAAVRIWIGSKIAAPQLLCDEFIYADVAENIATEGRFALRDDSWNSNFLYPALIAPAWAASSMENTYELAKGVNVGLMVVAGLIVFLWAKRLVESAWALVAAALTVILPQGLYATLLLAENGFLPAFLAGTLAIALALERPTPARQMVVLAAIGVASAVRLQALVLVPILVTAIAVKAALDLRARGQTGRRASLVASVKPFWLSATLLALGAVLYLAVTLGRGSSLAGGFGAYEAVLSADYSVSEAARWTRLHLADLALVAGVVPLSALLLLAWLAARGRRVPDPVERAFLAVTVAAIPWILAGAGVFASRFTGWVTERYTFYLAPLLIIALVVWLARGLPRPPLATALALLASLVLLESLSVERYLGVFDLPSSLSLYALFRFSEDLPDGAPGLEWLVLGGAAVLALSFALLPRRAAAVFLPAALAAFFIGSSFPVFDGLRTQSVALRAVAGANPAWVDDAVNEGDEAVFVFSPMGDVWESSTLMLQAEFWNERIDAVYNHGTAELCPLPERNAAIEPEGGRLLAAATEAGSNSRYVVADRRLELAGRIVAEQGGLALYDAKPPLRILGLTEGVYLDGWTGADAVFTRYSPEESGGEVAIFLSRPWSGPALPEGVVQVTVGTLAPGPDGQPLIDEITATREWRPGSTKGKLFVVPTPSGPFRIEIHVEPTFSPASYGLPDARQLGVKASFRFLPA
jgi:hypothetical protein